MGRETKISVGELTRLLDVVNTVVEKHDCAPEQAIRFIEKLLTCDHATEIHRDRSVLAAVASSMRRARVRRNEIVGTDLFRDPAWDMLLELFAAHESGKRLTQNSLCHASGVPESTALRMIHRLEESGLIERAEPRGDRRSCFIKPTPKAIDGVRNAVALLIDHALLVHSRSLPVAPSREEPPTNAAAA